MVDGDGPQAQRIRSMKVCFVTTGATAPFTGLIEAVLQQKTIDALASDGYTHLLVQYGTAKSIFESRVSEIQTSDGGLIISGIDFDPSGLQAQFQLVYKTNGLAISHAGRFHECFLLMSE